MNSTAPGQPLTDTLVDQHLDRVLRAAGSGIKHYSMAMTLNSMREAMKTAMTVGGAPAGEVANAGAVAALERIYAEIEDMQGWTDEDGTPVVAKSMILNSLRNKILALQGE